VTIEVVDYDDAWPRRAEAACAELQDRLPGLFTLIEYIGSTSVSGLAARPIIDLMAAAEDLARVTADDETLGLLGYQRHETGMPRRLLYRRNENAGGPTTCTLSPLTRGRPGTSDCSGTTCVRIPPTRSGTAP